MSHGNNHRSSSLQLSEQIRLFRESTTMTRSFITIMMSTALINTRVDIFSLVFNKNKHVILVILNSHFRRTQTEDISIDHIHPALIFILHSMLLFFEEALPLFRTVQQYDAYGTQLNHIVKAVMSSTGLIT